MHNFCCFFAQIPEVYVVTGVAIVRGFVGTENAGHFAVQISAVVSVGLAFALEDFRFAVFAVLRCFSDAFLWFSTFVLFAVLFASIFVRFAHGLAAGVVLVVLEVPAVHAAHVFVFFRQFRLAVLAPDAFFAFYGILRNRHCGERCEEFKQFHL